MLLEFKMENYKSFLEKVTFSMVAAPKQSGLDYSLLKEKVKGKLVKGLSSSVIYGPNAAGKTNIIGAIDVLRAIIIRGNIRNSEERNSPNAAAALELIPNNSLTKARPVKFSISFIEKKMQIEYELSMNLGKFLEEECCREIREERLSVNGEDIFTRSENLTIGNLKGIENYLSDITNQNKENVMGIAKNSLNKDELFLTNGFKLIFSQKLVKLIVDWFTDKCMVIYRADTIQLIKRFADAMLII